MKIFNFICVFIIIILFNQNSFAQTNAALIDSLIRLNRSNLLDSSYLVSTNDTAVVDSSQKKLIFSVQNSRKIRLKIGIGAQLNSLKEHQRLVNHTQDFVDSLRMADLNTASQSNDSLIVHTATVSQNVDPVGVSLFLVPLLDISLFVPVFSWMDIIVSSRYFTQKQNATVTYQSPSRYIDSNITLPGDINSLSLNYELSSWLVALGMRFFLSQQVINQEKKPLFFEFQQFFNLGNSYLGIQDRLLKDDRLGKSVGTLIVLGYQIADYKHYGIDFSLQYYSVSFKSSQSWQTIVPNNLNRDYLLNTDWSITSVGVLFQFFWK